MDDNNQEVFEFNHGKIKDIDLSNEMKTSFLNYAMSVIVSRALPDVRDGLKPVHRRILWGMKELGVYPTTAHKKSARIVGEVMGKYHPHGDSSIYDAMVRMAQDFSYRYPMVDGHGNFGSVDGDGAAAMRYTEARMSKISLEMIRDLDKDTVDFVDNYDATEEEPSVLPSRIPNLLINGATGIAVGMATNIPPHNLGEVIDGIIAYMDNNDITLDDLMHYLKGPDFPTGGLILGYKGLRQAYETGQGAIVVRAKAQIVEGHNGKNQIIITEIPYQVNKLRLIERIAEIVKEKIVEGITNLQDESNRMGMRIVIDLRRDINPYVMLNNLFKYTQLQTSYGINMIALVDNQPKKLPLKEILHHYVNHQFEVITRRTQFDLNKALARLHILEGLLIALDNIDEIINIIRNTKDGSEKFKLMERFNFSEIQAQSILDMQLKRLSGLQREKTEEEYNQLKIAVADYQDILAHDERKHEIIKNELIDIRDSYVKENKRISEMDLNLEIDIDDEKLIPVDDVIVTITNKGYAKRMKIDNFNTQNRGGTGSNGMKTNDDDYIVHSISVSTHDYLLFFTNKGRVYKIKGYDIPEGSRQSKGIPLVNIITFEKDEKLAAVANIKNFDDENAYLLFVTKSGIVKRTNVSEYKNIRTSGIIALGLREGDELFAVKLTDGNKNIILGASNGKAIRFDENDCRSMGRTASGVRGMEVDLNEEIIGVAVVDKIENDENDNQAILVCTDNGFGKRSKVSEYRCQTRGGKGVKTLNNNEAKGDLKILTNVTPNDDLIITTDKGVIIRLAVKDISQTGRATQGVKLIRLRDDQKVSTITVVPHEEIFEDEEENKEVEE